MNKHTEIGDYEVAVIGAGHAGCEAALAAARLGKETIVFTMSVDAIAFMPCNPHVGGSSKGHLVREVDALGGEMGKCIDRTYIQSRMLNTSKGPAVHSLRAQADKAAYSSLMRETLEAQEHLTIKQAEVCEILFEEDGNGKQVRGVKIFTGLVYITRAVIICTGVYLKSRCLCGEAIKQTGPNGEQSAQYLSESLKKAGIELLRFKTGTPARIDGKTIDFDKLEPQYGDETLVPFSFSTDPAKAVRKQFPCYLTATNEKTHEIIRKNLDRSPMYSGVIRGTGPRYCPSIEDKVVKFAEKDRHQVFLEPQGEHTNEWYVDGMSSSMPEDVQIDMYRSVPGLEHCRIVRNAYAIEYDCIPGKLLKHTLEFKEISGLFSAGQFNGSSGYEEAAAQGIIAGINAAMFLMGKPPITVDRSEGYIGVLIDDLVTKEALEPYRMMTSRAEYRLLLRQDNADLRLRSKGYTVGLISEEQMQKLVEKEQLISEEVRRLKTIRIGSGKESTEFLKALGRSPLSTGVSLEELIRRPELDYEKTAALDPDRPALPEEVKEQVNIEIKYRGYIERERRQVEQFRRQENRKIPRGIDFQTIHGLRLEARQKLQEFQPESLGQASRIQGVNPADISVLAVYLSSIRQEDL